MSLEAIEKITAVEQSVKERRAAAETDARQMIADAERAGLALLERVRADAAAEGTDLLRKAEETAAARAAEIGRSAEAECSTMMELASQHLDEAAEFIVGRVVKH